MYYKSQITIAFQLIHLHSVLNLTDILYIYYIFSDFATVDDEGLHGELDVDSRMLENISIVATVSHFDGISGLVLNFYTNQDLVAHSPQTSTCQPQYKYQLKYKFDATNPVIDAMVIRLTYTHSDLPREVQLASHFHRFNNEQGIIYE